MSRYIHPIAASLIFVVSAFTAIHSENWKISEDYSIKFTGNNATGIFKGLKGNVIFDAADPGSSSFNVTVDVATINTGSGMKNAHAKSEKWFDAKKYPTIGFKSSSITKTASGYAAQGSLTLHGVTKEFTMPFTFNNTATGGLFVSTFDVNRLDFNIQTPEPDLGAATILKVDLNVPVTR